MPLAVAVASIDALAALVLMRSASALDSDVADVEAAASLTQLALAVVDAAHTVDAVASMTAPSSPYSRVPYVPVPKPER